MPTVGVRGQIASQVACLRPEHRLTLGIRTMTVAGFDDQGVVVPVEHHRIVMTRVRARAFKLIDT